MSKLYRRTGGVYYTRLVVPPRLRPIIGKTDLGRSLRTKDRAEAKRLLPEWLAEAQAMIAAAELELARREPPAPAVASFSLTQEDADWQAENDRFWRGIDLEDEDKAEAEEAMERRLARPEAELSREDAATARLLRNAKQERDRYRDRYYRRKDRDERRESAPVLRSAYVPAVQAATAVTMLDTTIVDLWAAERKPTQKSIDLHRGVARWFYERVSSKPVDMISRADVLAFKSKLVEEGQTAANIKQKLSRLRTLLQWAADNGHAATNVAHGISIKDNQAARNKRKPFDLPSLTAIFSGPVHAGGVRPKQGRGEAAYWIPLLALFTGARMEELGQLRPEDVVKLPYPDVQGNEQQSWFVKLVEADGENATELKNAESERLIPIHAELERAGFVAFAETARRQGRERLFDQLTPGPYGNLTHKWGQWFGTYLRKTCGVTDKRMVFHSFRHTFTDYLRRPDIPEGIQRQLSGHSSKDVHDDYGSGYNMHWLVEAMKLYQVPGLTLPAPARVKEAA